MLIARFTASRLLAAWFLVLFQWATATGPARAQEGGTGDTDPEAAEETIEAGEIEIVGSQPSPSLLFEDPSAQIERIEVAPLRERYADLSGLLSDLAGVRVLSFGGVGRSASVSLRGSSGKQVLVLLDGVPLNASGEAFDFSTLPLDQLALIEVTRGNASAVYGAGAVGGVINLIPRHAGASTGGSYRLETGPSQTLGAALTGWGQREGRSWLAQGATLHTRGDFRFTNDNGTSFNAADDFPDRRANNESHQASFLWRRDWKAEREGSRLTTTLSGFSRLRGEPGILTFPSPETNQKEQRLVGDVTWRRQDWLWAESETEVRFFGRWSTNLFQDPLGEQTGTPISSQQQNTLLGLRAGSVWSPDPRWLWTGLVEATHEVLQDRSATLPEGGGDHERTSLGLALRTEWLTRDQLTLVGAVRADLLSDQSDRISPRLGLVWTPDPAWKISASAGNGYRPPSFAELADSRGFVVGNPDLKPEVSRAFDLGCTWADPDGTTVSASLFRTETRDLIEYVQLGGFRFKPLNFGAALSAGAEVTATCPLDDAWTLSGAWTWQDVTDATQGANRAGAPIPGRPGSFGQCSLQWRPGEWETTLTWHFVGENSVTFANTKQLPARETLDLSTVWRDRQDTVSLQISNLLDAAGADLRGFPLPGRTWRLAYTRSW